MEVICQGHIGRWRSQDSNPLCRWQAGNPSRAEVAVAGGSVGRASQMPGSAFGSRMAGVWRSQEGLTQCWRQRCCGACLIVLHQPPSCLLSSIPSSQAYILLRRGSSPLVVVAHLDGDSSEGGSPLSAAATCLQASSTLVFESP